MPYQDIFAITLSSSKIPVPLPGQYTQHRGIPQAVVFGARQDVHIIGAIHTPPTHCSIISRIISYLVVAQDGQKMEMGIAVIILASEHSSVVVVTKSAVTSVGIHN